jgi:hypothetical protein
MSSFAIIGKLERAETCRTRFARSLPVLGSRWRGFGEASILLRTRNGRKPRYVIAQDYVRLHIANSMSLVGVSCTLDY